MAEKIVEVPGVGNVSFPDSMSDDAIAAVLKKQTATSKPKLEATPIPESTVGSRTREAALGVGQGFGADATGMQGVDLPGGLTFSTQPLRNFASGIWNLGSRGVRDALTGNVKDLAGLAGDVGSSVIQGPREVYQGVRDADYDKAAHGAGLTLGMLGSAYLGTKQGQARVGNALDATANTLRSAPQAASDAVGSAAGKVAEKVTGAVAGTPEDQYFRAVKPYVRKIDFDKNMKLSMPEMKAAEAQLGKPIEGMEDAMQANDIAKKNVRAQFEAIKGGRQIQVDLNPVADAMENSISKKLELEDPDAAQAIRDKAQKYRRTVDADTAEDLLKDTNAELESYYDKNPTARRKAADRSPDTALTVAQGKALRTQLYDAMDPVGGGDAARQLQKKYGALIENEGELFRRYNVSKRQQPQSLSEQMANWHAAGRAGGAVVGGVGGFLAGDKPGAALGAMAGELAGGMIESKLATWLKERQSTDALIKSAFARYGEKPAAVNFTPPTPPLQLPAASGASVLPSSGQTFAMPANIGLRNMNDLQAFLDQEKAMGRSSVMPTRPSMLPPSEPPAIDVTPTKITPVPFNMPGSPMSLRKLLTVGNPRQTTSLRSGPSVTPSAAPEAAAIAQPQTLKDLLELGEKKIIRDKGGKILRIED